MYVEADQQREHKPEIIRPTDGKRRKHIYTFDEVESGISEEARKNTGLPCGNKPSIKEIEEHDRTHIPFRSWCKHCVFGKGQSHPHYKKEKEESGIPCISWDYMYMKGDGSKYEEEEVRNEMPIVVCKDSASKAEGAFVVPEK